MQEIIVEDRPYAFIPPHRGDWIPTCIQRLRLTDRYLKRVEGITSYEVRGVEHLRESLRQQHAILLAPNHCRYADPLAMAWIAREAGVHLYSMASWHLFQNRLQSLGIQLCGGFSVYREGVDRKSIETAVELLVEGKRPLVVFPEGTVFRSNDVLQPLLDGVAFIARTAARRRARQERGEVKVHPVAIKYLFHGDLEAELEPILSDLEQRFNWHRRPSDHLLERVQRLTEGLLALHEVRHIGRAEAGPFADRQKRLLEHLMRPLEERWLGRPQSEVPLIPRVKQLRAVIVPNLFKTDKKSPRRIELWTDLRDIYLAQQISAYPSDYLAFPTKTRILETVERMEEDLKDRATVHRPLHAILEVGEPIDVSGDKPPKASEDPLMNALTTALRTKLAELAKLSPLMTQ